MDNNIYLTRIRKLTFFLMLSAGANCFALATLIFYYTKDRPPTPFYEQKPIEASSPQSLEQTNFQAILQLKKLPYDKLQSLLTHTSQVENGYTERDLALACMVAFHYFDLKRALGPEWQKVQKRVFVYGPNTQLEKLIIFPGITDGQFDQIIHFANTEQWPFTVHGLLALLQKDVTTSDEPLAEMFYSTPEFLAVELLFNRNEIPVDKKEILKVIKDGDWALLSQFVQQQKISQDLSPARRQSFLLNYIKVQSKAAAYLLLKTDYEFALRKLDDASLVNLLELLVDKTSTTENFAVQVLKSPRSDAVIRTAGMRLYDYFGEPQPEKVDPQALLARFLPNYKPAPKPNIKPTVQPKLSKPIPKDKTYIVQEGDSLWKIAKKFKVDIESIKNYNKLKSDFLKPGTVLKIKEKTSN